MNIDRALLKAIDRALKLLKQADQQRCSLARPVQVVILVSTAQGILDNGGLQYFFESDFEDRTPYDEFCQAYREIGACDAGDRLEQAVALLGFPDPHLDAKRRNKVMESLWSATGSDFASLDSHLCGDETVWQRLGEYATLHREVLRPR